MYKKLIKIGLESENVSIIATYGGATLPSSVQKVEEISCS